jgi:DNA-directed RNA polymerase specialized sigma24 family protein
MAYEVVREAVGRLPEEPRSTLRMRFVDEATYPEIAATLGVPPRAAEKRVWRALSGLRARVDIS